MKVPVTCDFCKKLAHVQRVESGWLMDCLHCGVRFLKTDWYEFYNPRRRKAS